LEITIADICSWLGMGFKVMGLVYGIRVGLLRTELAELVLWSGLGTGGGSTADVRKGDFRGRQMSGAANVGEGQMSYIISVALATQVKRRLNRPISPDLSCLKMQNSPCKKLVS